MKTEESGQDPPWSLDTRGAMSLAEHGEELGGMQNILALKDKMHNNIFKAEKFLY